jgi:hypothetical protein
LVPKKIPFISFEKITRQVNHGIREPDMIHLAVYFNTQSVWDLLELLDMCIITTLHDKCHAMCEATLTAIDEVHTRCFIVFTLYGLRIKEGSLKEERLAYHPVGSSRSHRWSRTRRPRRSCRSSRFRRRMMTYHEGGVFEGYSENHNWTHKSCL